MLPAVADPQAALNRSPRLQHLDSLAKTPSWIGSNGTAYGVAGWVEHQAAVDMVRGWAANPAYNILLITRNIRAIDIDIAEPTRAQALEKFICERLGVQLPVRSRANSGKRTLLLRLDPHAPIRKRVIKTTSGSIEFLADGQQTALCGTHPSGARFELSRLEQGVPVVRLRAMEGLWDELRNAYEPTAKPLIVPEEQQAEYIVRNGGTLRNDHVLQWLEAEGWVLGYEPNGTANVRCPWANEHSEGGSPNATSWLPAGLGGKEKGAFRCLHAHCDGRHTGMFLEKIGHTIAEVNKTFAPLASGSAGSAKVSPTLQILHGVAPPGPAPAPAAIPANYDPFSGTCTTPSPAVAEPTGAGRPADLSFFTGVPMPANEPPPIPADLSVFTGVLRATDVSTVPLTPAESAQAAALAAIAKAHGVGVSSVVRGQRLIRAAEAERAFDDLVANALREAGQNLETDGKGAYKKRQSNLLVLFSTSPDALKVRYDDFTNCAEVSRNGGAWEPVTDNLITWFRARIEKTLGQTYERGDISAALDLVGEKFRYDSAQERLGKLSWDGQQRIPTFDRDILKARPSAYTRAVSNYMWVAMVGRVMAPGAKADIAPILISPKQGTGKSSLVSAMALDPSWYGKINLEDKDDNVVRRIQGKVTVEMPELRGITGRDASSTKDFLSTSTDAWVPKYREKAIEARRRCLFIGTDNRLRILTDPTGNRRWAPVRVATTAAHVDWPRMQAEIEQYWAEAVALVQRFSSPEAAIEHYAAEVRDLAGPAIVAATVLDPWSPGISHFMLRQATGVHITLADVHREVLNGSLANLDRTKAYRIRDTMTALGYEEVESDVWIVPPAQL